MSQQRLFEGSCISPADQGTTDESYLEPRFEVFPGVTEVELDSLETFLYASDAPTPKKEDLAEKLLPSWLRERIRDGAFAIYNSADGRYRVEVEPLGGFPPNGAMVRFRFDF